MSRSSRSRSESSNKGAWLLFSGGLIAAILAFISTKYTADTNREIVIMSISATQTAEAKLTLIATMNTSISTTTVTMPTLPALGTGTRLPATRTVPPAPTPTASPIFSVTPADDLRTIAFRALPQSLSINTETALYEAALDNHLGYAVSDEFQFPYSIDIYVGQVFQKGVVYVRQGDWANIRVTERSSSLVTREPLATEAFRYSIRQHQITVDSDSWLMKEAQVLAFGPPLTSEFEFTFHNVTYVGQLFMAGLVCANRDLRGDVIYFGR